MIRAHQGKYGSKHDQHGANTGDGPARGFDLTRRHTLWRHSFETVCTKFNCVPPAMPWIRPLWALRNFVRFMRASTFSGLTVAAALGQTAVLRAACLDYGS